MTSFCWQLAISCWQLRVDSWRWQLKYFGHIFLWFSWATAFNRTNIVKSNACNAKENQHQFTACLPATGHCWLVGPLPVKLREGWRLNLRDVSCSIVLTSNGSQAMQAALYMKAWHTSTAMQNIFTAVCTSCGVAIIVRFTCWVSAKNFSGWIIPSYSACQKKTCQLSVYSCQFTVASCQFTFKSCQQVNQLVGTNIGSLL